MRTATIVALMLAFSSPASPIAQTSGSIRFVTPTTGTFVVGPVVLRVGIAGLSSTDMVVDVTFFADGQQVCVAPAPRVECSWDAGPQLVPHTFRAVARLKDGTRLPAANLRTDAPGYVDRVSVDIILANAVVSDGSRFVTGLTREAFRLFDDGQERPITSFESTDAALDVVLALDISASMQPVLRDVQAAAIAFVKALRPQDRLTVVAFNDRMFVPVRNSASREEAVTIIGELTAVGSTALFDAVVRSLDLLARQSGKHALVLFSDGEDRSSQIELSDVQRAVNASDAMVFGIGLGPESRRDEARRRLEQITGASGGRVMVADRGGALRDAFAAVVREVSNQYTLGFEPRRDGRTHTLKIELVGQRGQVRARRSYSIPAAAVP